MQALETVIPSEPMPKRQRFNRGWGWVYGAFELYLRAPLLWTLITLGATLMLLAAAVLLLWLGLLLKVGLVPFLLPLPLLFCVLLGSILQLAKTTDEGSRPDIAGLLAAFSAPKELLKIGAFYLIATVMLLVILTLFMLVSIKLGWAPEITPDLLKQRGLRGLWPFLLMFITSFTMICSVCFFAPALVVLRGLPAREAMQLSFIGFWRNWLPVFVMGLVCIFVLAVAVIPFFTGLLVAVPVTLLSFYISYMDIYEN